MKTTSDDEAWVRRWWVTWHFRGHQAETWADWLYSAREWTELREHMRGHGWPDAERGSGLNFRVWTNGAGA